MVSTAKTADLILIMMDATKSDEQRRLLEYELDAVGIRLNKQRPDVVFKRKTTGGVSLFHWPLKSGCVTDKSFTDHGMRSFLIQGPLRD